MFCHTFVYKVKPVTTTFAFFKFPFCRSYWCRSSFHYVLRPVTATLGKQNKSLNFFYKHYLIYSLVLSYSSASLFFYGKGILPHDSNNVRGLAVHRHPDPRRRPVVAHHCAFTSKVEGDGFDSWRRH